MRNSFHRRRVLAAAGTMALLLGARLAGATPITILETATGVNAGGGAIFVGYLGTRFQAPFTGNTVVATAGISSQFFVNPMPEMFAAIIQLSGPTDKPDSANLTTPDVLRSAVFTVTQSVSDFNIALNVPITSGQWYALAFGTGLLGANAVNIAATAYATPTSGSAPFFTASAELGSIPVRFKLTAEQVPEPGTLFLLATALAALAWRVRRV